MKIIATALLTATAFAAPAIAQTTPPVASPAAAPAVSPPPPALFTPMPIPPTDPVRLAAAKPVIDLVWPMGTYARVMNTMMDQIAQGAMAQMFNMKPEDLVPGMGAKPPAKPGDKPSDGQTLGQMAAKDDPYFQQRMQLTMHVMGEEMGKLMTEIEPGVRDALAHAYARRFTVTQLNDLDRFFATPTGHAYAADSMTLMMSPDMMQAMQSFMPRMLKALPDMMVKVAAATKDLPPPTPKKKS